MPRIDLHQSDTAVLHFQFLQTLDHDFAVAAVTAVAHVLHGDRNVPSHGFRMRAAHRIYERRLAIERHDEIGRKRMPLDMTVEPQHAGPKAPVAPTARGDT